MIEHIPEQIDAALLYFHSAGTTSNEIAPFLPLLIEHLPNTYIWAGDGVIGGSPLMGQGTHYVQDDKTQDAKRYWFTFPMQDASSPESFAANSEAMGAVLTCAAAYVNAMVDSIMARFQLPASRIVLSGFQHGSCVALAAAMARIYDPYALTVLIEPYILEGYYLEDVHLLPATTVACIDNEHIRSRTLNWLQADTVEAFRAYGMNVRHFTVDEGNDALDAQLISEAARIMRRCLLP
jgi:hypothetical protein